MRKLFFRRSLYLSAFLLSAADAALDVWRLLRLPHITPPLVLWGDIAANVALAVCLGGLVHYLYVVVPKGLHAQINES